MRTKTSRLLLGILLIVMFGNISASAFYDPGTQRWLNRDPIGEDGGINLFEFGFSDPLNTIDSFGECPLIIAIPTIKFSMDGAIFVGGVVVAGMTGVAVGESLGDLGGGGGGGNYTAPPLGNSSVNAPPTSLTAPVAGSAAATLANYTKNWEHESPNPDKTQKRNPRHNRPDGKQFRPKDTTPKPPKPAPEKPRPEFDINEDGTGTYPPSPCK
jgi:hypothetical protein